MTESYHLTNLCLVSARLQLSLSVCVGSQACAGVFFFFVHNNGEQAPSRAYLSKQHTPS